MAIGAFTDPGRTESTAAGQALSEDGSFMAGLQGLGWGALGVLDAMRLSLIRLLGPLGRQVVVDRRLRVGGLLLTSVGVAFALTVLTPLWLLAVGPLVLGVPHLLADIRYLVIRPGYHRRRGLWVVCGLPILASGLNAGVAVGLLGVLGATFSAQTLPTPRLKWRDFIVVFTLILMSVAAYFPWQARLVMAHAHNVIALALWWGWQRKRSRLEKLGLGVGLVGALLLLSGWLDGWVGLGEHPWQVPFAGAGAQVSERLGLSNYLSSLSPPEAGAWGPRLVLLFAFTQSLHYATWLRLIPDDDRSRPTPRTFKSSWRALLEDFGPRPLLLTVALAAGLALWGTWDLASARDGYFTLALFHGQLELSAITLRKLEARPS